jgi:uncharacterized protein
MTDVIDNKTGQRFELATANGTAHLDYELDGDVITFTHTIVPPDAQGSGVGTRLVRDALADVRSRGLTVVPACSFVAAYLRRHPDAAQI